MSGSHSAFDFLSATSPSHIRTPSYGLQPNIPDRRVLQADAWSFDGPTLGVLVWKRDNSTKFFVHRSLVIPRSGFFQRMTNALDHKDQVHIVSLPDGNPEIFRLYLNLIYSNQVATKGPEEWYKLCRLYVLIEKLEDLSARNPVIDGIYDFFAHVVLKTPLGDRAQVLPAEATKELYDGTSKTSQARRIVVDLYAEHGCEEWLRSDQHKLPIDFVYDVAACLLQKRAPTFGLMISRSSMWYHEASAPQKKAAQKAQRSGVAPSSSATPPLAAGPPPTMAPSPPATPLQETEEYITEGTPPKRVKGYCETSSVSSENRTIAPTPSQEGAKVDEKRIADEKKTTIWDEIGMRDAKKGTVKPELEVLENKSMASLVGNTS